MTEARQASSKFKALATIALVIAGCITATGAFANGAGGDHYYSTSDSPFMNAEQSCKNNPDQKDYMDGPVQHGKNGEVSDKQCTYSTCGANWPAQVPGCSKQTDPRSFAAIKACNKATGCDNPAIGRNLVSGNVAATALAVGMQQAIARAQMPESVMPLAKEMQNQQNQCNADNSANMERNQAGCAIDYVRTYLENFTSDGGNKWNRLRNELFIPIAMLLLLPGAVLAQGKAIVAQGFSIFGHVSPFDGIIRALVAIFLIPSTALVVNYGIDVSNSINHSIRDTYQRIFGSDMYTDAMSAHIRAFPVRQPSENKNYIPRKQPNMKEALGSAKTAFGKMEGRSLSIKLEDPVAGLSIVPEERANEMVPYFVNQQRQGYNGLNAGLATTWTILCAFQMAYLYYLWFVGPVVAALWVWPMKQLRDALPNWVDGVVTLCFWSLFWNTTVLIMACFRGVDDTGTVIMTALNFLSTACVKFAFDFSGLVKAAGAEAAKMAEKASSGGKGGGKGGSGGGQGGQTAGGQNTSTGGQQSVEPGKLLPSGGQQSSFPETSASSSSNESCSSLAASSSASERRSDSTEEASLRGGRGAWQRPYLVDGEAASGSRAQGGTSRRTTEESQYASAALVPPPPGQGASDVVIPGVPGISGQQVGEFEPPLLLNRLEQVASAAQSADTSPFDVANPMYVTTGSSGLVWSNSPGGIDASSGPAGFSGYWSASSQATQGQFETSRQFAEQANGIPTENNPQALAQQGKKPLSFIEMAALTGIAARTDKMNGQGSPNDSINQLPPAAVAGVQSPSPAYPLPPRADQASILASITPSQYSQVYGDVSVQPQASGQPVDDARMTFAQISSPVNSSFYPQDASVYVPMPTISSISSDNGSTSFSANQVLSQTASPAQASVYLTQDSRPLEYANAAISSPTDIYAVCGLYDTGNPSYQTAAYASATDAAYQTAAAQADVRAARQSAIALVLGRANCSAPPV